MRKFTVVAAVGLQAMLIPMASGVSEAAVVKPAPVTRDAIQNANCSSVAKGLPYKSIPGSFTSSDAIFAKNKVWWFGDSISARCSWEFAAKALPARGKTVAFNVRAGAFSQGTNGKLSEALSVGVRTKKTPEVIVWEFGANDSIRASGPRDVIASLTAMRKAYPKARIIWPTVYRGLTHQLVQGKYVNALQDTARLNAAVRKAAPALRVEVVDWAGLAHAKRGTIMRSDLTHPTVAGPTSVNGAKQLVNLIVNRIAG